MNKNWKICSPIGSLSKGLQIMVDKLECYFNEMNLIMNYSKSACIVFKHNIRYERSSKIFFNGEEMPRVKKCLYLVLIGNDVGRCYNILFEAIQFIIL